MKKHKVKKEVVVKRKLKKSVKVALIVIGLLLIITISIILFVSRNNKQDPKKKPKENESKIAIVEKKTFDEYEYKESFNDYLFVVKDDKLGAIDKNGKVIIDFTFSKDDYIYFNDDLVVIETSQMSYLYDKDLNLVLESKDPISYLEDVVTGDSYYIINNTLYNLKKEEIFRNVNSYIEIVNDYLITENYITNLKNDEKIKIEYSIDQEGNIFALSPDEDKLYIYDYDSDMFKTYEITAENMNCYNLKDEDGNEYFYSSGNGLIVKEKGLSIDNYKLNFKECSIGFKIYSKDGKTISEECYDDYFSNAGSKVLFLSKNEKTYILYESKLLDYANDDTIEGNYVVRYNAKLDFNEIYDLNGKKIEDNTCYYTFEHMINNNYLCGDGASVHIMDEKFNKLTDEYDELFCMDNSDYCIFSVNHKYGILENNEVLIPAVYDDIMVGMDNTQIIATGFWNFDVYYLKKIKDDNYLKKDDLKVEFSKPYANIDTSSMIDKYNLSKYEKTIYENEELFKKYAYIVENNNSLGNYKNKVMNLFYEVALNKQYLDESYFFESLEKLNIVKKDQLEEDNYVGLYYDDTKKVEISDDQDNVIYHELTHFLDYSITSELSNDIFKCGNDYVSLSQFNKLNSMEKSTCELVFSEEPNFMIEGGSEYFSGHYLNGNILRTYYLQTNMVGALTYLYGYDTINEIFFNGKDGSYDLFMLFNKAGISLDEYKKFLEITHRYETPTRKELFYITDILIKLYESKNSGKWYEDKEFSEIISMIIERNDIKKSYTSRYQEYQKLDFDFNKKYEKILESKNIIYATIPCGYLKDENYSYLVFRLFDKDYNLFYKIVKYDFENGKVLE